MIINDGFVSNRGEEVAYFVYVLPSWGYRKLEALNISAHL